MRLYFTKPVRILIISLLSTILFIIVASTVVSVFYEKAVIRYMKKYMDEHLLTQISMDDIHFSVLKGFPGATVDIERVVMLSGDHFSPRDFKNGFADTLLKAREVSFRFDLIKLFHKDYSLKKIEISDGFINILVDKNGHHNLHIWKSDTSGQSTQYSVNLQNIVLTDMRLRWIDLKNVTRFAAFTHTASFKGDYTNQVLTGNAHANMTGVSLSVKNARWINNAGMLIQTGMRYGDDRFTVSNGRVRLNKADMAIQGEYKTGKKGWLDLEVDIPRFGLAEMISMIPAVNDSLLSNYRFTGKGSLKVNVHGTPSDPDHLQVSSVFNLSNGSARNLQTRMNLHGINVTGSVSGINASKFTLHLSKFTASMGKGKLTGKLELRNLRDLNLDANARGDIDLSALGEFLSMDTIEYLGGMVRADFAFTGSISKLRADSAAHFLDYMRSGTFYFDNAGLTIKKSVISVRKISGRAVMNGSVYLDSVQMTIHDNQLMVNGTVRNLSSYLLGNGILESNLVVNASNYSINYLLQQNSQEDDGQGKGYVAILPKRMHLKARLHSDGFDASRFRATDLSLTVALAGDSLQIPSFSLKFGDGSLSGNAFITQKDPYHTVHIRCNSISRQIDIHELFTAFNNFAQKFIIDKNLKGSLNGTINFSATWDSVLRFIPKSLLADADIEIRDGELIQFEPMLALSKYINVDELRLIRFQTLKNSIHIEDRIVSIPEMDIHSSAFNIGVAGHQNFDNLFEYRLNVLLSEVLFNKARKKKKEMNEFFVEDDIGSQTTIPLLIAGTPDNFDVKFDRKRAFSLTRQHIDKPADRKQPVKEENGVRVEWEENKATQEPVRKKETKNKQEDEIQVEWNED